jgi:acyl-CoA thioester hydrolase
MRLALTSCRALDIFRVMSDSNGDPGWRFYLIVETRFADVDMFDHINNAKYLTYVESARVAYYTAVTGIQDPREFGMTVASAKVDFLKPVFFGQTLRVSARAGRIGNKSWTLEHELRDAATGELMATASTVNVHYDYESGQSKPLPADIVEKLERFEGRKLKDR